MRYIYTMHSGCPATETTRRGRHPTQTSFHFYFQEDNALPFRKYCYYRGSGTSVGYTIQRSMKGPSKGSAQIPLNMFVVAIGLWF